MQKKKNKRTAKIHDRKTISKIELTGLVSEQKHSRISKPYFLSRRTQFTLLILITRLKSFEIFADTKFETKVFEIRINNLIISILQSF